MHITHLALGVDAISSVLMDIAEHPEGLVQGGTRDEKLATLYDNYRDWCESSRHLHVNIACLNLFFQVYYPQELSPMWFYFWLGMVVMMIANTVPTQVYQIEQVGSSLHQQF